MTRRSSCSRDWACRSRRSNQSFRKRFYGQDSVGGTEQAQSRDGEEIRRAARGVEGEEGLRGTGEAAARRVAHTVGEPLLDERTAPRLFAEVLGLASDVPRS